MSKPKTGLDHEVNEVEPGPDQGEQRPYPEPLPEPPPDHDAPKREPHPIEAALTSADEAVRKAQGGPEGSGIKALLAITAAQIGVKII